MPRSFPRSDPRDRRAHEERARADVIFAFFYLAVLLLAYMELRVVPQPRRFPTLALPAWSLVAFLIVAYAAQLALEFWAATHLGALQVLPPLPIPSSRARWRIRPRSPR